METREVSKLKTNPQNPRGAVEHDVSLRELAMSIKSLGILQPILITENDYIVAGHRRVEAAKLAGLEHVPVIVKKLSQLEQLQMMLVENLQRADLNVLQEGAAYKTLIQYGLTPSLISKAIGVSGARVADCLAIQDLPAEIQRQFAWGSIPVPCASVLATLPTAAEQVQWADAVITRKMNAAALREAIHPSKPAARQSTTANGERTLRERTRTFDTKTVQAYANALDGSEPEFEDYVIARRVVLYEYELLRRCKYEGQLNIASDEMVASIVQKSCAYLAGVDESDGLADRYVTASDTPSAESAFN